MKARVVGNISGQETIGRELAHVSKKEEQCCFCRRLALLRYSRGFLATACEGQEAVGCGSGEEVEVVVDGSTQMCLVNADSRVLLDNRGT